MFKLRFSQTETTAFIFVPVHVSALQMEIVRPRFIRSLFTWRLVLHVLCTIRQMPHAEKFGTCVGGPIFHCWSTCQSMISHLRFPIGLLLPKCHESFARPHRLLWFFMSRTMAAMKLKSIHCENFYKALDTFLTAFMTKRKQRKIYLFSGEYFEVERLNIVERKSKEEISRAACHSFSLHSFLVEIYYFAPLKKARFLLSFGKEKKQICVKT